MSSEDQQYLNPNKVLLSSISPMFHGIEVICYDAGYEDTKACPRPRNTLWRCPNPRNESLVNECKQKFADSREFRRWLSKEQFHSKEFWDKEK